MTLRFYFGDFKNLFLLYNFAMLAIKHSVKALSLFLGTPNAQVLAHLMASKGLQWPLLPRPIFFV